MSVNIKEASYVIVHCPDFVRYGSKPIRDIQENPDVLKEMNNHLRNFEDVINYAPHQVFIGNKHPDELYDVPKPWYEHLLKDGKRKGPFGEIMPEDEFYGWMKVADDFDLLWLDPQFIEQIKDQFASHPFVKETWVKKLPLRSRRSRRSGPGCARAARRGMRRGSRQARGRRVLRRCGADR